MSFELVGLSRDADKQLVPITKNAKMKDGDHLVQMNYVFVPYILNYNLNVYVKNVDDGWQIFEQISQFFTPDWAVKVHSVRDMDYKDNIIIKKDQETFTDNYEGAIDARRMIIWTYNFSMNARFYGPIKRTGLIKRAIVDLIVPPGTIDPKTIRDQESIPIEVFTTYPGMTANGEPTTDPLESISYFDINAEDNWAYIEEWKNIPEGKVVYSGSTKPPEAPGMGILSPAPSILNNQEFIPQLVQSITTTTSTVSIDLSDGGYVILNLNNDVTNLSFTNWPQNIVGRVTVEIRNNGNYHITNYPGVLWLSVSPPDNTEGAGKKDIFVFHSADGGMTVYGNIVGINYTGG